MIEAEVAYSTVAENNLLREAVFKKLREGCEVPPPRTPGPDAFAMKQPPRR